MSNPLSPLAMLATSMQAQPGVYALLLGSGVSTSAGVPTGWGVVTELVHWVAVVEDQGIVATALIGVLFLTNTARSPTR